jgi:hypothetical protein
MVVYHKAVPQNDLCTVALELDNLLYTHSNIPLSWILYLGFLACLPDIIFGVARLEGFRWNECCIHI